MLDVIQLDSSSQDHRIGVGRGALEVARWMYSNSESEKHQAYDRGNPESFSAFGLGYAEP
jgi:hypothetical protein